MSTLRLTAIVAFAVTTVLGLTANAALVQLSFSDIVPGTENTTLVTNGDFESNGGNNSSSATGWTGSGQMFVTSDNVGGLIPSYDAGSFVAKAHVSPFTNNGGYFRLASLAANTDYVLSAYMWNLSDPNETSRQWNVNVDLNDVPTDPQLRLFASNPDADQGYFVYNTFNTQDTGANVIVRVFYDVPGGGTTGWPHQPVGALWDRIAITPAAIFSPPVPEPSSLVLATVGMICLSCYRCRRRR